MSRMVSRRRIAQVAAVLLGLLLLAMGVLDVVLDRLTHFPGSGGPLVDSLTTASAALPAAAVATLLAARRPRNPIGWLLFGVLFVGANPSGQYDVWAYRMHPGTVPFGWVAVVIQECGRCSWSWSPSCSGCSPTGGCRAAGGGARP